MMDYISQIIKYPLWLFRPKSILDASRSTPIIDVPNWERVLFVSEPDKIKKINKYTGKSFLGGKGNAFLGPLLGEQSVFLLDGEKHKLVRSLIMKVVGPEGIAKNQSRIQEFVDSLVTEMSQRKYTEVTRANRWLTFQIIMGFTFVKVEDKTCQQLFKYFERTTGILANIVSYNKSFWYPSGKISVGHIVRKMVHDIDKIIYALIDEHTRESDRIENNNLLDVLLREQKIHGYDIHFIRDSLVSVIAAGYDTSGSALSWLSYWMANTTKSELADLRQEVMNNSEKDTPQVNAFINETLRYCSPIEILPRKINSDALDGVHESIGESLSEKVLKRDGLVSPCPYAVHHNPEVYSSPEEFNPRRFIESHYKPNEFLPFGGGHRYCLGYIMGNAILKTYLCTFLRNGKMLKLKKHIKYQPVRRNVSLWPAYKMNVIIREI